MQTEEGEMRVMGILAVLIGAFEVANGLAEAWLPATVNHNRYSLVWGTMAAMAGALLVSSGVALVRKSSRAAPLAWSAAIGCLGVFALISVIQRRLSIVATLLGLAFPFGLMLFLYLTHNRQRSASMA
jgi:hypothetical protein